jgi:hypothetical protein
LPAAECFQTNSCSVPIALTRIYLLAFLKTVWV